MDYGLELGSRTGDECRAIEVICSKGRKVEAVARKLGNAVHWESRTERFEYERPCE